MSYLSLRVSGTNRGPYIPLDIEQGSNYKAERHPRAAGARSAHRRAAVRLPPPIALRQCAGAPGASRPTQLRTSAGHPRPVGRLDLVPALNLVASASQPRSRPTTSSDLLPRPR